MLYNASISMCCVIGAYTCPTYGYIQTLARHSLNGLMLMNVWAC